MVHQQESFHPLSFPARSRIVSVPSPALSVLHSSKLLRESSACPLYLALLLPKPRGKGNLKSTWFTLQTAWLDLQVAAPGFKTQRESSSATPFLTPPTISYTRQHSCIFPAFLGFHN